MNDKGRYVYLINFLIKIRNSIDGFNSPVIVNFNDIDTGQIKDKEKLFEMLDNFKRDEVLVDYERKTVIEDYEID